MKKFLAIVLTLAMALSIGSVAMAAEEQTAEDIMKAVAVAEADVINIELKNDISDYLYLDVPEDCTVTISGDYALGAVEIYGKGRIDLKVKEITEGLWINDAATVNVEAQTVRSASVIGRQVPDGDWSGFANAAVTISGDATVSIKADLIGGNGTLPEEAMKVSNAYADGGEALYISEAAPTVTVVGNITGGNSAGTYAYGGYGIYLYDSEATVTVTGNVTGGNVNADPTVEPVSGLESYGGTGIYMEYNRSTVKVNGNVTGGHTNGYSGYGGEGIYMYGGNSATAKVNGNVTGGDATGAGVVTAGYGIVAPVFDADDGIDANVITVSGTVASGKGKDNAAIYYELWTELPNLDVAMLDYEQMKAAGTTDQQIIMDIFGEICDGYTRGFLTKEEVEDFHTENYKKQAELLNYELPVDYKATVKDFGAVDVDEHIAAMMQLMQNKTPEETAIIVAAGTKFMVENYKALLLELYDDSERFVTMPLITAWQILPGDSGLIYTVGYDADESDMKALEIFSADTITYTVKVADAQGGRVTADKTEVKAGETVTLKSTADAGYTLGEWKVYGKAIEGNTFEVKVGGGILVEAAYESTQANPPTGDGAVWFALLAVTALAGAAVLTVRRKKA